MGLLVSAEPCMPITPYLDDFDVNAETKRVLGVALEKTRVSLGLGDNFADGIIAKRIVELAKAGERLPARRRQLHRGDGDGARLLDRNDDRAGPRRTSDCANRTDACRQTRVVEAPGYASQTRGGARAETRQIIKWP